VVQEIRTCLLHKPRCSQFCFQIAKFLLHWQQGSRSGLNTLLNCPTPKKPSLVQESELYTNRVIAKTAVKGLSTFFGESGSTLLLIRPPIQFGTDSEQSSAVRSDIARL